MRSTRSSISRLRWGMRPKPLRMWDLRLERGLRGGSQSMGSNWLFPTCTPTRALPSGSTRWPSGRPGPLFVCHCAPNIGYLVLFNWLTYTWRTSANRRCFSCIRFLTTLPLPLRTPDPSRKFRNWPLLTIAPGSITPGIFTRFWRPRFIARRGSIMNLRFCSLTLITSSRWMTLMVTWLEASCWRRSAIW